MPGQTEYLKTYRTPAACFKKASVRRETGFERFDRLRGDALDRQQVELDLIRSTKAVPPVKDPIRKQYYTPSTGGKRVKKVKHRKPIIIFEETSGVGWPD